MFKHTPAFSSFSTPDLAQAKEFYGRTLGLDVSRPPRGSSSISPEGRPSSSILRATTQRPSTRC
jgi:hypothetical protein